MFSDLQYPRQRECTMIEEIVMMEKLHIGQSAPAMTAKYAAKAVSKNWIDSRPASAKQPRSGAFRLPSFQCLKRLSSWKRRCRELCSSHDMRQTCSFTALTHRVFFSSGGNVLEGWGNLEIFLNDFVS